MLLLILLDTENSDTTSSISLHTPNLKCRRSSKACNQSTWSSWTKCTKTKSLLLKLSSKEELTMKNHSTSITWTRETKKSPKTPGASSNGSKFDFLLSSVESKIQVWTSNCLRKSQLKSMNYQLTSTFISRFRKSTQQDEKQLRN